MINTQYFLTDITLGKDLPAMSGRETHELGLRLDYVLRYIYQNIVL